MTISFKEFFKVLFKHKTASIGFLFICFTILLAIFAPVLAPYSPTTISVRRLEGPSSDHLFGTDYIGRDNLSRIIFGSRASLGISLAAVFCSLAAGLILGTISGFYGGNIGMVVNGIIDLIFSFPAILLALIIAALFGATTRNVIIALSIVYTPIFSRVVRGAIISVKENPYVEAARAIGLNDKRIIFKHIIPNMIAPIIVQMSLALAWGILAEASLSFLGFGTQPPTPSWGVMLSRGREYLRQSPWMAIFSGMAIAFTVLSFNMFGDGLRDTIDPTIKK